MNTDRIDFISSYCDRWCERCAFTARCSSYAVEDATAMCDGDLQQAIELVVGEPHAVGDEAKQPRPWLDELANVEMSPDESDEFDRQDAARKSRTDASDLSKRVRAYTMLSHRWLDHHVEHLRGSGDPVLVEALNIVCHDCAFVGAKLQQALDGRDRRSHDGRGQVSEPDAETCPRDPVQNDWNGSAKVALISLERSDVAWRAIAQATSDPVAAMLADALRDLRHLTLEEFPRATSFVRPGFDEPWR